MSISTSLERTIAKMEAFWRRDNGDFDKTFPDLLDDARKDVERVRGLECVAAIPIAIPANIREGASGAEA